MAGNMDYRENSFFLAERAKFFGCVFAGVVGVWVPRENNEMGFFKRFIVHVR